MKFQILSVLAILTIIIFVIYFNFKTKTLSDQLDNTAIYKISLQENYDPNNKTEIQQ